MARRPRGPTIWERGESGTLYILYRANGTQRRHRVGQDRRAAEIALKRAELALAEGRVPFADSEVSEKLQEPFKPEEAKPEEAIPATTLSEFLERYLEWSRCTNAIKTYRDDHCCRLRRFAKIVGGSRALNSISVEDIERFKGQRLGAVAPSSAWGDLKTVRAFLNKAVAWGELTVNPAATVKQPKIPERIPRFLSDDQVEDLLKVASRTRVYRVALFGVFAGLRKQEIERLEWTNIDFERRVIRVTSKEGWRTKNSRVRTIPLHPRIEVALAEEDRSSRWVVPNNDGSRYAFNMLRDLKLVAKKAKITEITIHLLRHTFASRAVKAGVSIFKVSKWLGHSSVETTLIYAHLVGHDDDIGRL